MFVQLESGEIVFRVAEATTYIQRAEVACWSTTILVQPGDYPVSYARLDNQKPSGLEDAYYVCAGLPGVITEDFYPALFGGVIMTSYDRLQNAGKPATYHLQVYSYMVREVIQKQLAADLYAEVETIEKLEGIWQEEVKKFSRSAH